MFNIEAKYDVTIRNFRIPFLRAAESVTVSLWVHDDGPFWYEKNNPSRWRWVGSPDAYSPGKRLNDNTCMQHSRSTVDSLTLAS